MVGNVTYGTGFAQAGFTYDANLSPFNQGFSLAVQAVIARTPVNAGTSFVNIVVTGTATIQTLQVTTATIATENVSTSTITQLVVGTGTFSQLTASGTATFNSIYVTGTSSIAGNLTASGTATFRDLAAFGATAGALVGLTVDSGTFTGTLTGMTATVNTTCTFFRIGKFVAIFLGVGAGTSNATTFTMTGLPAELQPAANTYVCGGVSLENNGLSVLGSADISPSGTISFYNGAFGATWTSSGAKGMNNGLVYYLLN